MKRVLFDKFPEVVSLMSRRQKEAWDALYTQGRASSASVGRALGISRQAAHKLLKRASAPQMEWKPIRAFRVKEKRGYRHTQMIRLGLGPNGLALEPPYEVGQPDFPTKDLQYDALLMEYVRFSKEHGRKPSCAELAEKMGFHRVTIWRALRSVGIFHSGRRHK